MKLAFSEWSEGGCVGRPEPHQYFVTQKENGTFFCHWSEEAFLTLEEARAAAQKHFRKAIGLDA